MTVGRALLRRAYEVAITVAVLACVFYGVSLAPLAAVMHGGFRALGGVGASLLLVLAIASVASAVSGQVGPIWATRGELTWMDAGSLVRRRRRMLAATALVVSLVVLAVVVAAAGPDLPAVSLGVISATTLLASVASAHLSQLLDVGGIGRGVGMACTIAALALLGAHAGTVPLLVLCGCTLYAAAVSFAPRRWAGSRPSLVPPKWELLRAGGLVEALWISTVMLDGTALELLRDQRLGGSRRLGLPWVSILVAVRALTSPRVVLLLPALCLPACVLPVWGSGAAACALTLATFFFAWRVSRPWQSYMASAALQRTYAVRGRTIPVLVGGTTVALAALFAGAGALTASMDPLWALAATAFATLGVLRRLSGRRMSGRVGALLSTPMGPVPIDLARRVAAGADVAAAATILTWSQGPVVLAVGVGLLTLAYFVVFTSKGR